MKKDKDYTEFKRQATAFVEELNDLIAPLTDNELKLYVSYHYVPHDITDEPFCKGTSKTAQLCDEKDNPKRIIAYVLVEGLTELERLNKIGFVSKTMDGKGVFLGILGMKDGKHAPELLHRLTDLLEFYRRVKLWGRYSHTLTQEEELGRITDLYFRELGF